MSTGNLALSLIIKYLQSLVLAVQKITQTVDILLTGLCYNALLSSSLMIQRYELYEITIHLKLIKYCVSLLLYTVP
jgi:hypothetical protein